MDDLVCIPYRWELRSRSNFDSHTDIYVLDYINYSTTVDESKFAITDLCQETEGTREHNSVFSRLTDIMNVRSNIEHAEMII